MCHACLSPLLGTIVLPLQYVLRFPSSCSEYAGSCEALVLGPTYQLQAG